MDFTQTVRTKLKRLPNRGVFERSAVYRILDEGFICHVGFVVDGNPVVIPTGYARAGDQLLIHGSQASRMLRTLKEGFPACVTVTLVDGLVLARSAFHHSINYRSVVIFGTCSVIVDPVKKNEALRLLSEHIIAGRWDEVRPPTDAELSATTVLSLPLLEASAKVRTGPPIDDEEDYSLNVWAGVIPLTMEAGPPVPDQRLPAGVVVPDSARHYRRNQDST